MMFLLVLQCKLPCVFMFMNNSKVQQRLEITIYNTVYNNHLCPYLGSTLAASESGGYQLQIPGYHALSIIIMSA